ncbi:uncharacterized protein LOC129567566 [Sitodiplosis mosellana]|uniref:uncharacterized protein LOC129567566 n=1 Tax=Sitodiplosis mosellana TaxID=263140 RepID=UPI0024445159|nr:uncharacterized protein LOC129567566 [Sitodiplosis mosellana]
MENVYKTFVLDQEDDSDNFCVLIKTKGLSNFDSFKEALFNRIPMLKNMPLYMFYKDPFVKNPQNKFLSNIFWDDASVPSPNLNIPAFGFVQSSENKPYRTYTREDKNKAIEAIKNGMTVSQASRKYRISWQYLYDTWKKMQIADSQLNEKDDEDDTDALLSDEERFHALYKKMVLEILKKDENASKKHVQFLIKEVEALKVEDTSKMLIEGKIIQQLLKLNVPSKVNTSSETANQTADCNNEEKDTSNLEASPSKNGSPGNEWILIENNEFTKDNASIGSNGSTIAVLEESTPSENMDDEEMIGFSESWRNYQEARQNMEADDNSESGNETVTMDDTVGEPKCQEPVSMHSDPRVNEALSILTAMGFKNDDGSLTELLEMVDGNISKVLQLLETPK